MLDKNPYNHVKYEFFFRLICWKSFYCWFWNMFTYNQNTYGNNIRNLYDKCTIFNQSQMKNEKQKRTKNCSLLSPLHWDIVFTISSIISMYFLVAISEIVWYGGNPFASWIGKEIEPNWKWQWHNIVAFVFFLPQLYFALYRLVLFKTGKRSIKIRLQHSSQHAYCCLPIFAILNRKSRLLCLHRCW